MLGLMADADVQGHVDSVLTICRHGEWRPFWDATDARVHVFADFGLLPDVGDAALWHLCQEHNIVLVTGNRNQESDESLESTIRRFGTLNSLPVLTLSDAQRLLHDRIYAERVAAKLIEYLLDMEGLRGSGRLYLP